MADFDAQRLNSGAAERRRAAMLSWALRPKEIEMAEWNLLPHEEAKLLSVARDEALIAHADHAYLPNTPSLAALFQPHDWVMEAMRRAYSLGRQAGAHRAREEIRNALGVK